VVQFRSGIQCWVTGSLLSSEGKKLPNSLDVLKLGLVHRVEVLSNKHPVVSQTVRVITV
jgi:hypothetical protein